MITRPWQGRGAQPRASIFAALTVAFVAAALIAPRLASAQDRDVQAYFIEPVAPTDPGSDILAGSQRRFEALLNRTGRFQLAGSQDMEVVYAECGDALGISPEEQRECQLNAARRSFIDWYVEFSSEQVDESTVEVVMEVWDPDENRRTVFELVEISSPIDRRAANEALEQLACALLRHRALGYDAPLPSRCVGSSGGERNSGAATTGGIEVIGVTPSPAEVFIDGQPVGVAPGQYPVAVGEHEVVVRAPGHRPHEATVDVSAASIATLHDIALEPLPAALEVASDVGGAAILVDGERVGETVIADVQRVEVPSTSRQLRVVREGYVDFEMELDLAPGSTRRIDVGLEPIVCGNGRVEGHEGCDDGNTDAGDGCDPQCRIESAPEPTTSPSDEPEFTVPANAAPAPANCRFAAPSGQAPVAPSWLPGDLPTVDPGYDEEALRENVGSLRILVQMSDEGSEDASDALLQRALMLLDWVYLARARGEAIPERDFERAIADLESIIDNRAYTRYDTALLELAQAYFMRGRTEAALEASTRLIREYPNSGRVAETLALLVAISLHESNAQRAALFLERLEQGYPSFTEERPGYAAYLSAWETWISQSDDTLALERMVEAWDAVRRTDHDAGKRFLAAELPRFFEQAHGGRVGLRCAL